MEYALNTLDLTKTFEKPRPPDTISWIDQITVFTKKIGERRKTEKFAAVDHVNLKVERGELFGLLGPNGAGKTTLIKLLSCLLYPDEGTASVNGYDIRSERRMVKASINVMISGGWLGLNINLTIRKNLEFFASLYGLPKDEAKQRIKDILIILGLDEKENDVPFFLSSGMRQKVLLAKAFLIRTPILLLDEPTIGLDPVSAWVVRDFVKNELNRKLGQTVVLSTHHMEEAELLCDRVAIMDHGKMIACDTPQKLRRLVKTEENQFEIKVANYTHDLVMQVKQLDLVTEVFDYVEDPTDSSATLRIHTTGGEAALPKILQIIEENGAEVVFVSTVEPSLEDVFIKLTGRRINE